MNGPDLVATAPATLPRARVTASATPTGRSPRSFIADFRGPKFTYNVTTVGAGDDVAQGVVAVAGSLGDLLEGTSHDERGAERFVTAVQSVGRLQEEAQAA